jgi:hypothetical protein
MRTTLSLDDDVAALLERVRKQKDASLKQVVNEALREGLTRIIQPAKPKKPFRTGSADLGKCFFPSLDSVWDVIAEAEGEDHR